VRRYYLPRSPEATLVRDSEANLNDALGQYVAKAIMKDIRDGTPLDDDVAASCNSLPLVDWLRNEVRPQDADRVLDMFSSAKPGLVALGASLLRGLKDVTGMQDRLQTEWELRRDFDHRYRLMWRLLDYPLTADFHDQLYRFTRENWSAFLAGQPSFFGAGPDVLPSVETRLADRRFPPTKAWAYLCCAKASPDTDGVTRLLRSYAEGASGDDMAQRVARELMSLA
jgi:hypothetical protein